MNLITVQHLQTATCFKTGPLTEISPISVIIYSKSGVNGYQLEYLSHSLALFLKKDHLKLVNYLEDVIQYHHSPEPLPRN